MHYKVSVIVPIYNVRDYLARCVENLMNQTLREVEYIFVEDCATDDSYQILMDTLARFPHRRGDVRVIRHEVNKGLTMSRADGLDVAAGDFIIHSDSDDWTDVTMFEKMYDKAVSDGAEICICDFFHVRKDGLKRENVTLDCRKPHKEFMRDYLSYLWNTVWCALVAREVYKRSGARPPVGITFTEDFYLMVRLFQFARKFTKVNEPLYYYNQMNSGSIMHSLMKDLFPQESDCYERTIDWFKGLGVYEDYRTQMQWRLLKSSCYLVFQNRFDELREFHPESHRYILSVPSSLFNFKVKVMMILAFLDLDFICRWDNKRHGRF